MNGFAERIKKLREEKKLKVAQVAKSIGVSVSTYRDWEYGREIKGESAYVNLARFYGVSLSYIIQGKEETEVHEELMATQMRMKECLQHVNNIIANL
jgi:transcriptional regulator with XRE-family HTH domain